MELGIQIVVAEVHYFLKNHVLLSIINSIFSLSLPIQNFYSSMSINMDKNYRRTLVNMVLNGVPQSIELVNWVVVIPYILLPTIMSMFNLLLLTNTFYGSMSINSKFLRNWSNSIIYMVDDFFLKPHLELSPSNWIGRFTNALIPPRFTRPLVLMGRQPLSDWQYCYTCGLRAFLRQLRITSTTNIFAVPEDAVHRG